MPEPNQNVPATVPEQPESKPPLRKSMPVVIALVVIIGLIGIANLSSLLSGNKRNAPASAMPPLTEAAQETAAEAAGSTAPAKSASVDAKKDSKGNAMAGYDFDTYDGRLYRIFEGTVLEGVVTNHIDGGFSGPIMVSLTTDLYSHDHQQLLLPQGTRLLGDVQSVGNSQQRKMFVTFHRAICPDGFSLEFA